MNLAEFLSGRVTISAETTALIDFNGGQRRAISFAELEQAAARAAALLRRAGLQPGEAVLVFQPMSIELYVALLALFRLGLVAMFVDPAFGRAHIERCCRLYPPQGLIASSKAHLLRLVSSTLRRIPHKFVIGGPLPGAVSWRRAETLLPDQTIHPCRAETPALITFTSGSTGLPKAVVRSHGFLRAQHQVLQTTLAGRPGTVDLATMPIVTLTNLASGVTSLIPAVDLRYPGRIDPAPVVTQIQAAGVSSTVASPALLERLARYCLASKQQLPGLRNVFTGGAPVFPRLLEQLQQIAPRAEITAVYGSTEAEPIAKIGRDQLAAADLAAMLAGQGLLAGWPVDSIRVQVITDHWGRPIRPLTAAAFAELTCPPGRPGEIVVSGDHVLTGYLHGQGDEETKFAVAGAIWHRTGDAGYLDDAGRLWLLGRCAARISDERGILYPFAAECALYQYPQIRRAAALAVRGRRVMAVEYDQDMARPDQVQLLETLAWAQIDELRVLDRIPVDKRHNAKIDYPALSRLLA